jgi:hypothetical protein
MTATICVQDVLQRFNAGRLGRWRMDELRTALTAAVGRRCELVAYTTHENLDHLPDVVERVQQQMHEDDQLVLLLPAHTGTPWFHAHVAPRLEACVFLRSRVVLPGHDRTPPYDQMLLFIGGTVSMAARFLQPVYVTAECRLHFENGNIPRSAPVAVECGDDGRVVVYNRELVQLIMGSDGEPFAFTVRS